MRISSTLTQVGGNFARPTKYSMILSLPSSLRSRFGEELDVLCKSVQSPAITNESYEIKVKGHPLKIPGRTIQNQEINITFYIDDDYEIRKLFQDWIYGLDNRNVSKKNSKADSITNNEDFYATLELIGRDFFETTSKPISWEFEDVFPLSVGEIEFNTADKDTLSEITVTFGYTRFNTTTPTSRDVLDNLDDNINQIKG